VHIQFISSCSNGWCRLLMLSK